MAITVANRRDLPTLRPEGEGTVEVYVGRPSPLGNPFRIGRDGERAEVIAQYVVWLDGQLGRHPDGPAAREFARLLDLTRTADLVLVCHCAPLDCHGDVIKARLEAAQTVTCQHEGCDRDAIACWLPRYGYVDDGVENEPDEPDDWYCPEHAEAHGYCRSCGTFEGGLESFEVGPDAGFCDYCQGELRREREIDREELIPDEEWGGVLA